MSELKTTQQSHADNDISLAWDEYEKCGEVVNYAENLLHAAEFYQTEAKTKEQENEHLTAIATKHATRADELYEALKVMVEQFSGEHYSEADYIAYKHGKEALDKSRIEAEEGL